MRGSFKNLTIEAIKRRHVALSRSSPATRPRLDCIEGVKGRYKKESNTERMNQNNNYIKEAERLYRDLTGVTPSVEMLAGAGSDRRYLRLKSPGQESVIATFGRDVKENRAFVELSAVFRAHWCKVPEVYVMNKEGTVYLQEDLGSRDLLSLLATDRRMSLSAEALKSLVRLQTVPEDKWRKSVAFGDFSRRLVMWDLNYFKYEFLKPAAIVFDEELLENDFERLAAALCEIPEGLGGFMYRDFQSRNIIIKDDTPYMIDFQGGRYGPLVYDAVSFLWQAKAGFTDGERAQLLNVYAQGVESYRGVEVETVLSQVDRFALFRTLQVLGAYGFRGLVEKKAHFIESIPGALANLSQLLEKGVLDGYPELESVAHQCVESRFAKTDSSEGLTVKVFSFSYKKGYPEDITGNGGGFMFDCRGMHNPGRYDRYKPLTGLDKEVRDFLEEQGEVQKFVEKSLDLVRPSVVRYAARGFKSLQVGFGCTGGRHRSVYCAQAFAEELSKQFPDIRIRLEHREQDIVENFPKA